MTLPANIRVSAQLPFPSLVVGSGPITIGKANGIWTAGFSISAFGSIVPPIPNYPTDFLLGYDQVNNVFFKVSITNLAATLPASIQTAAIQFVIDGAGAAITTGLKGYIEIPFSCTITQSSLFADQTGSIVVNVWKTTFALFNPGVHPVVADKITASAPPTIAAGVKAQDATLTGWTTTINAGDILAFNVDSVTTIQRVTIDLKVTKT